MFTVAVPSYHPLRHLSQVVTRRGVETAVLVPIDEWNHLKDRAKQSIPGLLLDPNGPMIFPPPRVETSSCAFPFDDGEQGMMFLLDNNVVSELRKNRPHAAVVAGGDRFHFISLPFQQSW